jgi:hypothetical protein
MFYSLKHLVILKHEVEKTVGNQTGNQTGTLTGSQTGNQTVNQTTFTKPFEITIPGFTR